MKAAAAAAAPAPQAAPGPTREQLLLAWRHVHRPHWPATLDAALQVPHYAICLTAIARNLNRAPWAQGQPPLAHVPAQPMPATAPPAAAAPSTHRTARHHGRFDPRRAAANDFDED